MLTILSGTALASKPPTHVTVAPCPAGLMIEGAAVRFPMGGATPPTSRPGRSLARSTSAGHRQLLRARGRPSAPAQQSFWML